MCLLLHTTWTKWPCKSLRAQKKGSSLTFYGVPSFQHLRKALLIPQVCMYVICSLTLSYHCRLSTALPVLCGCSTRYFRLCQCLSADGRGCKQTVQQLGFWGKGGTSWQSAVWNACLQEKSLEFLAQLVVEETRRQCWWLQVTVLHILPFHIHIVSKVASPVSHILTMGGEREISHNVDLYVDLCGRALPCIPDLASCIFTWKLVVSFVISPASPFSFLPVLLLI